MKLNSQLSLLSLILLLIWSSSALASKIISKPDLEDTRHFLQRSGFAQPPGVVQSEGQKTVDELISSTVNNSSPVCPIEPPAWTLQPLRLPLNYKQLPTDQRRKKQKDIRVMERMRLVELQYWWLSTLIYTDNPLAAKMILFWQNHFTSEQRKVRHTQLMYQQHQLFQQHSLGNFRTLLSAVMQDPAMLIYLDNRTNRKNKPNENLARELFELFTLGEGHFSETDIKEAARTLTGYTVTKNMQYKFLPKQHDHGEKTILGSTDTHDMDSLIELLLEQPQTANTIVSKLWTTFISPTPDAIQVEKLSALFRAANYEMRPLLTALFESDAFWRKENRSNLIKSPAQYIADTLRVWQLNVIKPKAYLSAMKNMEQLLFNPPNVKGWQGGTDWINANTLLARNSFMKLVLRSAEDRDDQQDINKMNAGTSQKTAMTASMEENDITPSMGINALDSMSVEDVKISLLGSTIPLQSNESLNRDTLIQDLLLESSWQLY